MAEAKTAKRSRRTRKTERAVAPSERPRLREVYRETVVPELIRQFSYRNRMQVPRLVKVVLNMGCGDAIGNARILEAAQLELGMIAGQRPAVRRARKSVSNFHLRAGMPIGLVATLRGDRMYEFFDRFLNFALPRVRDFRGLPSDSFDGRGNYSMGIREHIIFPEVNYDRIEKVRGLDVTVVTSAVTDEEARALLLGFGMPFADLRSVPAVAAA
jgi:large subunit ribosomal protein L5